jgi:hypothetical protein
MASNAGSGIRLTDESARLLQNDITCESADIMKFSETSGREACVGEVGRVKNRLHRVLCLRTTTTSAVMEPLQAKLIAAGTGSLLTAITSKHGLFLYRSDLEHSRFPLLWRICIQSRLHGLLVIVTPFDVVKTRLQTQPPKPKSRQLFARPPPNVCCQPNNMPCVRGMASLAIPGLSIPEVVCVWDRGVLRQERVNGFYDAVKHVVRAEGLRGLWKGAGTTMFASPSCTLSENPD